MFGDIYIGVVFLRLAASTVGLALPLVLLAMSSSLRRHLRTEVVIYTDSVIYATLEIKSITQLIRTLTNSIL